MHEVTVKELKYFFLNCGGKSSIVIHSRFWESSTRVVNILPDPLRRTNKSKSRAAAPSNLRTNHKGRHKQKAGEFSTARLGREQTVGKKGKAIHPTSSTKFNQKSSLERGRKSTENKVSNNKHQ